MSGPRYTQFKGSLVGLLYTQRTDVFERQASPEGPWEPIGSQTERSRRRKTPKQRRGESTNILVDNGVLRASFTQPGGPQGNSGDLGDEVFIQTGVEYARIHNEGGVIAHPGTDNGFGKGIVIPAHPIPMPARPFDQFFPEQEKEIAEFTEAYLNE